MKTKFKHNQICRLRDGFYRGSFVKLLEHSINKNNINEYKVSFQNKTGDRFVDINPKKFDNVEEHLLFPVKKIFGVWI